jgi:predicted alpha/beta-hydrolase family hydrolase
VFSSARAVLDAVPVTPQGKPDRIRIADLLGSREQAA